MQTSLKKLAADAEYQKSPTPEFNSNPDLPYIRMESTLFRCFDSVPAIETGPRRKTAQRAPSSCAPTNRITRRL